METAETTTLFSASALRICHNKISICLGQCIAHKQTDTKRFPPSVACLWQRQPTAVTLISVLTAISAGAALAEAEVANQPGAITATTAITTAKTTVTVTATSTNSRKGSGRSSTSPTANA